MTSKRGRINQSAIYQRIPGQFLSPVVSKKPQSFAVLKLPPSAKDPDFAKWEGADKETTLFDEAKKFAAHDPKPPKDPALPKFRDSSWAKWEVASFSANTSLETALERIESENSNIKRLIKMKLTFCDGSHLLFERSNWSQWDTLVCKEYYSPHAASEDRLNQSLPATFHSEHLKTLRPLTDAKGHLVKRPRDPLGEPLHRSLGEIGRLTLPSVGTATQSLKATSTVKSSGMPGEQPGKVGFDFTPVGYNSALVRPSKYIPGVRPGLRETNRTAYQTLRKDQYLEPTFVMGTRTFASDFSPSTRKQRALAASQQGQHLDAEAAAPYSSDDDYYA